MYKILLIIYCWWSNRVQWFERKFLKCEDVPEYQVNDNPVKSWKELVEDFTHYGSDPWYKGSDAISAPERFMVTKKDDCDTFALLGRKYFGEEFVVRYKGFKSSYAMMIKDVAQDSSVEPHSVRYVFLGLVTLYYGAFKGHVIAVWKMRGSQIFFVVDNKSAYFTRDFTKRWKEMDGKKLKKMGFLDVNGQRGSCLVRATNPTFFLEKLDTSGYN